MVAFRGWIPACIAGLAKVMDMLGVREGYHSGHDAGIHCTAYARQRRTTCRIAGSTLMRVDISDSVLHFKDIGHDPGEHNIVYENAQARERTQS